MAEHDIELSAVVDQLSDIRILLIAVLIAAIISACVSVLSAVSRKTFRAIWGDYFRDEAKRLFDGNNVEALVALAKDTLKKRPNHVYAHWYLGRAYYLQEKWSDSLAEFREVARIDPTWIDDNVNPYVKAIESKMSMETVH